MNAVISQSVEQLEQKPVLFCLAFTAVSACLSALHGEDGFTRGELSAVGTCAVNACREMAGLSAAAWKNRPVRQPLPHTPPCALIQTQTTVCLLLLEDTCVLLPPSFLPPSRTQSEPSGHVRREVQAL